MKILLTAPPRTGKSTIVKKFIELYPGEMYGILSQEIRDENDQRIGFKNINLNGEERVFMHVSEINSEIEVGNKYKVDLNVINNFVVPALLEGMDKIDSVILIDEIGRAQSYSDKFLSIVEGIVQSDSNFLGTIVFDDEPWSIKFKNHPDVLLISVTEDNRDDLPKILVEIFLNNIFFRKLTEKQQNFVLEELKKFLTENQLVQAKKLFKNAVVYVADSKVKILGSNEKTREYAIEGKTNDHITTYNIKEDQYTCDCDLFNGRGEFEGNAGICSHIEAIKIINSDLNKTQEIMRYIDTV